MKHALSTLIATVLLCGCSASSDSTTANLDASVPYANALEPLVGHWASGNELALIVEREGNQLFIRNPVNDTWRFEVLDATTSGSAISFTQKSFLLDGSSHPFNGVPCRATISPIEGDIDALTYSLSSEHVPDDESDVFTRIPNGG